MPFDSRYRRWHGPRSTSSTRGVSLRGQFFQKVLKQTQPETVCRLKDKTATTAVFVPRKRVLQVTLPQLQTRAAGRWDRGQINRNDENEKKTRPLGYMDHDFGFAVVDVRQSYLQPAHRSPVERFSR